MKRLISIIAIVAWTVVWAACERSGSPKGSGALPPEDKALFDLLPANSTGVFGGNYMKLQQFMSTTFGKTSAAILDKLGPGMLEWSKCFTEQPIRVAGSGNVVGKGFELRMVFTGRTIEEIGTCAARAHLGAKVDPDGQFIAVELPPPTGSQGYLRTATGAVYNRQMMEISAAPTVIPTTRADLENDLKTAAARPVTSDDKLLALIGKADRSKTLWFVASGTNTPIADKMGEVIATADLTKGLALDLTVQLLDPALIEKLDDGIVEMKKMSGSLPASLRSAVESIRFDHRGDRAHMAIQLDDKQLADVMQQASLLSGH